jgi:hypothetical protein
MKVLLYEIFNRHICVFVTVLANQQERLNLLNFISLKFKSRIEMVVNH